MANSGSFRTNGYNGNGYPDHYVFSWSLASQSIEGNYSDINWSVVGAGGSSSGRYTNVKQKYVNVNGSQQYNETTTRTYNGTTPFSGTTRIYHNADGTGSFSASCGGAFYYYGSYNSTGSGSWSLPTIPRASSISSSANFVKGDVTTITVNRASGSFTHTIKVYVGSTLIKTFTGIATSVTWTPTQSEVEAMLKANTASTIKCTTYNGSTQIGSTTTKTGTASNPTLSTVKDPPNITLGSSITVNVTRNKDFYSHTLTLKLGSTTLKNITNVGTSTTLSFTNTEINTIYSLVKNSPTATLTVECTTYIRGANAGKTSKNGTLTIPSAGNEPTFTGWAYKGMNTTANSVLGTDQVLIQGYNGIEITCNKATGKNQASIVKYQAIINGLTFETTDLTNRKIIVSNMNLGGNNTCQVRAVDSRGFITMIQKTLTFINYSEPNIPTITMKRKNNYDKEVTLSLVGNISRLFYNNAVKNDVVLFKYRYKKTSDIDYSTWVDIPTSEIPNTSDNYYKNMATGEIGLTPTIIGDFDIEDTYSFQFELKDKLNDLFFTAILVNGIPLIALRKGKVGINCVPDSNGTNGLYVNNSKLNILNAESVSTPTFTNSWSNYGSDYDTAAYYKDKDRVFLQGLIKGGTVGTSAFTLPSGYRPKKRKIFTVNSGNSFGRVDILTNGNVLIDGICSNSYVSLEGISFRI